MIKKQNIIYPKFYSHRVVLKKINKVLKRISAEDVANAFLYSLSTRKLEYRSALGSYWYAIAIPKHKVDKGYHKHKFHCYLCGWDRCDKYMLGQDMEKILNYFYQQRYKYGGVMHTKIDYALFDLEQFLKLPKVIPTDEDKEIIKNLLMCIKQLKDTDKAGKLKEVILKQNIFKTNKDEVSSLLDILGICGVLASKDFPCYYDNFVDEYQRSPIEHKNDFAYPVNRWRKVDGINYKRFEEIFNFKF